MTSQDKKLARMVRLFQRLADVHAGHAAILQARAEGLQRAKVETLAAANRLPDVLFSQRTLANRCAALERDQKALLARVERERAEVRQARARELHLARKRSALQLQAEQQEGDASLSDWCDQALGADRFPQAR